MTTLGFADCRGPQEDDPVQGVLLLGRHHHFSGLHQHGLCSRPKSGQRST